MPRVYTDSIFDRAPLAARNVLYGDLRATFDSILAPQRLSPTKARTLAEEFGVGDGPFGAAFRAMTHPVTIIGFVLGSVYPVAKAANLFRFAKNMRGYERQLNPWLSKIRSIHANFAGSPVPDYFNDLMAYIHTFKSKYSLKLGEAFDAWEKTVGRPMDMKTQILLASKLDGLDEGPKAILRRIDLDAPTSKLYQDVRGIFQEIQHEVWEKVPDVDSGVLKAFFKGGYKDLGPRTMIDNYFPHRMPRITHEIDSSVEILRKQAEEIVEQYEKLGLTTEAMRYRKIISDSNKAVHLSERMHSMLPDLDDLKVIQEYVKPGKMEAIADVFAKSPKIKPYSLRMAPVTLDYVRKVAHLYGWGVRGMGKKLLEERDVLRKLGDRVRLDLLENVYLPMGQGALTNKQAMTAQWWADRIKKAYDIVDAPSVRKIIGDKTANRLVEFLRSDRGPRGALGLSGGLASYFYTSALGANPASATLNLMQTVLTTVPTIGARWTAHGFNKIFKNAGKYFDARKAGKIHEEAISAAWPEFAEAVGSANPIFDEAIQGALDNAWRLSAVGAGRFAKGVDRTQRALMSMFQGTENIVRLVSFEGTMGKALSEGLDLASARRVAQKVTNITQFLAGPSGAPAVLADMPPLLRQFMQFPLRSLEYATFWATRLGSGEKADWFGRNWGTLGRMMSSSAIAFEMGKGFGLDLERGLWPGTFPLAPDSAPFAPMPVPPVLSLIGGAIGDLRKGEFKNLPYSLPLLVPGGIGLARMASVLGPVVAPDAAPTVARALNRRYVDYENPGPDGRFGVYSGRGNLMGYAGYWDLIKEGWGVGGAMHDVQALNRWMLQQRDKIRTYRREYTDSLAVNDYDRARHLKDLYESDYPNMGGLQIKKTDIRAAQLRREVPVLERVLETFPAELRPMFAEAIMTALANEAGKYMGLPPDILQTLGRGTARSRLPLRSAIRPMDYGPLSPLTVQPGSIQPRRSPLPDVTSGFAAFQSF